MVEYILGGAVLSVTAAYLAAPLLKRGSSEGFAPPVRDPGLEREKVYAALADLEYDFRTGKLDEGDYVAAREALMAQAASWLKAEEEWVQILDRKLEEEIAVARQAMFADPARRNVAAAACPICDTALLEPDQPYCHRCGGRLAAEEALGT